MIKKEDLYNKEFYCNNPLSKIMICNMLNGLGFKFTINSAKYEDDKLYVQVWKGDWLSHSDYCYSERDKKFTLASLDLILKEEVKTYQVEEEFIKLAHGSACADWKKKLEEKFPEVFKRLYSIGTKFRHNNGDIYILAEIDNYKSSLVNINTGATYSSHFYPKEGSYVNEQDILKDSKHFHQFLTKID